MGLIFSYTMQVDTAYLLCENRKASEWSQVREKLQVLSNGQIPPALTEYRHYEVDVNPYPILGQRFCVETTRYIPAPNVQPHGSRGFENWISGLLAQWHLAQEALVWAFNELPSLLIPKSITSGLSTLEDQDYVDKSFKVLDLGAVNSVPAYAIELSFDLANAVANLDKLFDLFVKFSQPSLGGQPWWIAGPVGVRFVQSSDAYLAPQYGRVTCMAELDMLQGINHGEGLLKKIQQDMTSDTTVRVHWGLELDTLNGPQVEKMYPRYNRWLNIYRQLNTTGVFNSPFTDRLGITVNEVDQSADTTNRNRNKGCIPC
jgi:L-gulono-1,4-lactone dehydrogenase